MTSAPMTVRIGTSGFNYKHWARTFYPDGLPQSRWLAHYAERFDTVELNVTFYRLPTPAAFRTWHRNTGEDFRFVIKGSRFVTHIKRLRETHLSIPKLMRASRPLAQKRACVLWQLPPQMKVETARLREFVDNLQRDEEARRLRHAFEFRHESWLLDKVYEVLRNANMTLVHADMPFEVAPAEKGRVTSKPWRPAPATADWWYLRRHGPNGVHTAYTDAQLARDARWIQEATSNGQDVYVYFNNDVNTHAPRDAIRLREMVQGSLAQARTPRRDPRR
jgi:uncharacterized protein YecE (DUF72 family)